LSQPRDSTQPIEAKLLRSVCGLFVTGVTVITSGAGGRSAGATVNSFTSVSLAPPLVLFCLHKESRLRLVVEESGMFVVNFLAGQQVRLAWTFSKRDSAAIQDVAHHRSEAGMPILTEALAFLACRLVNEFEGGDHTIFVGEVVELGAPRENHEPLIFFRGSMSALEDEPVAVHPIWDG
jgi:flavin reductase (DIM6/NTAB) family NADH-FMN oxidoreductase RutF